MAVAFVQTVNNSGLGVNSHNIVVNAVAAGNFLGLCTTVWTGGGGPSNVTPTSSPTNTWNTTTAPTQLNGASCFICYAMNAASGNTTITVDYGTGFYIRASATEFSGVSTSAAIDQQAANNGSSTAPTSGTTGTTVQANELVMAVLCVNSSETNCGIDPATTGYTNLFTNQNSAEANGHSSDYKIVSATGTQSAAWGTLTVTQDWIAKIATFKEAGAAAATSLPLRRAFPMSIMMQ